MATINIKLLNERASIPQYATEGSAAMDIRAAIDSPITIAPRSQVCVGSGIAVDIKDPGMVAVLASRSGLSLKHKIRVAQGIGVIDSDYHGEIGVILENYGDDFYTVNPGDRIAQLMFMPVIMVTFVAVGAFESTTGRGTGGFGHTGNA